MSAPDPTLTETQRRRYARHVLLPEVGAAGQLRLLAATVRVVGAGPAAEEAATYLAAAGVGRLVVEADLADRLAARIAAMNPDVRLVPREATDTAALTAAPLDAERRAAGAEAALSALVATLGLAAGRDHLEGF